MLRTFLFGVALIGAPLAAQQKSALVGNWKLSYPGGARFENGVMTPIAATGLLTIQLQGDSLVGLLVTEPVEGQPTRPPLHLSGLNKGDSSVFVSKSSGMVNINGEQHPVTSTTTWILAAHGEKLEGSLDRKIAGLDAPAPSQGPQKLTGTRQAN